MKKEQLLLLKKEILEGRDSERLLELDINLKQLISILDYRIREKTENEYTEGEITEFRSSLAIARSYMRVIGWKLENFRLEREKERIDAITKNKRVILEIFESGMESVLNSPSDTEDLHADNIALRDQLSQKEKEIIALEKRVKIIAREVVGILEKTKRE